MMPGLGGRLPNSGAVRTLAPLFLSVLPQGVYWGASKCVIAQSVPALDGAGGCVRQPNGDERDSQQSYEQPQSLEPTRGDRRQISLTIPRTSEWIQFIQDSLKARGGDVYTKKSWPATTAFPDGKRQRATSHNILYHTHSHPSHG